MEKLTTRLAPQTLTWVLNAAAHKHGLSHMWEQRIGPMSDHDRRTEARSRRMRHGLAGLVREGLLERREKTVIDPAHDFFGQQYPAREITIVTFHLTEAGRRLWLGR